MEAHLKTTTLTDGSKVFDVDLYANGKDRMNGIRPEARKCIFSCPDEIKALAFMEAIKRIVSLYTIEQIDEI